MNARKIGGDAIVRTILRVSLVILCLFLIGSFLGTVDSQARMTTVVVGGPVSATGGGTTYATPTRLQATSAYSSSATYASSMTANSFAVAIATGSNTDSPYSACSCTFSDGTNSWTTSVVNGGDTADGIPSFGCIGYAINSSTTAKTVSVSVGGTCAATAVYIAEYSGVATTSPVIGSGSGNYSTNASTTTFVSGSAVTASQTHVLLIGGYANAMAENTATYANWTKVTERTDDHVGGLYERILTTASGDYTFTGTMAATYWWTALMTMFKAAEE